MTRPDSLPQIYFETQADWEAWLEENHASAPGVWLIIAKKNSGIPTVTNDQAVESALCYGWIDGLRHAMDERYYLQRFTPRRKGSQWSLINRRRAEHLIEQGRMRSAGRQQVELARADGRWDAAYASQSAIEIPEDFTRALDASPAARTFFHTLTGANRYAMLYRITTARKPETRAAHIQKFIEMLARGEKVYP